MYMYVCIYVHALISLKLTAYYFYILKNYTFLNAMWYSALDHITKNVMKLICNLTVMHQHQLPSFDKCTVIV